MDGPAGGGPTRGAAIIAKPRGGQRFNTVCGQITGARAWAALKSLDDSWPEDRVTVQLVIGNKNYSSWSLRPWLLMRVKDIAFEEVLIPLYQTDSQQRLRSLGTSGKVPVLIDGALSIWDSLAITEYLAETFPEAGIWPRTTAARARARSISAEMHSGFNALRAQMPMNLRVSRPWAGRTPESLADISRITALWEDCLCRFGGGTEPFLFGSFSAADAFFAPVVTRLTTYSVPLSPTCQQYVEAIQALPALQEWTAAAVAEPWRIAASEIDG